jgi:general secretion pathway protein D
VRRRLLGLGSLTLALALLGGCATGSAIRHGDAAVKAADWDAAVAYYRQALARVPNRVDLRIKLERAVQTAGTIHLKRARDLEEQDQLPGAAAEYRKAADIDPGNIAAHAKYRELERRMRLAAEASRPPARVDTLRAQAAQSSPIPRLDPRAPLQRMSFNASVRDVLNTISALTKINITSDRDADAFLSRLFTLEAAETSVEDLLNQVLQANQLVYKVTSPNSIFVYQDNTQKRLLFEEQYLQMFYISYADASEISANLQQIMAGFTNLAIRPVFTPNKTTNTLTVKATASVLKVITSLVNSIDKPKPQVMIEAEILEVNRNFVRSIGVDLNQWALGFTFSPEVSPPLTSGTFPPATPPPFNANTVSGGISAADFYATTPTALIKLLESNTNTKVLARPQLSGSSGDPLALKLGDQVPIPTTVFQSTLGGPATTPTTQVAYQSVGVNLVFTPKVTYQDEIILEGLTLEKSGLGPNIETGGQVFPTIVSRRTDTTLSLRDGESRLISGLFRDDDRRTIKSLPGLSKLPILGQIFGNTERQVDQTDLVMVITAHIIRSHDLRAEDLAPVYIGTGQNVGTGNPPLLSESALTGSGSTTPVNVMPSGAIPTGQASPAPPTVGGNAPTSPATPGTSRAPGIVPIEAVPSSAATPPAASAARISITVPSAAADGSVAAGSGPFTLPIQIANAADVATVTLTVTYTTGVLTSPVPAQGGAGSFMRQGNVTPTFAPGVNPDTGRIDLAFARPAGQPGASGAGMLGAVSFVAGTPGTATITIAGVVTTTTGQSVPVEFTSARVIVK